MFRAREAHDFHFFATKVIQDGSIRLRTLREDGLADQNDPAEVYEQAAREWLAAGGGRRKATINDVASLAGVSKKTISRIINDSPLVKDETRKTVKKIIDIIGYAPDPQARGLAFRHSFLVGMIYDNPNPQYVVNMQQGILDGLLSSEHELVVHPCDRSAPQYVEKATAFVERLKLFGVILTPSISEDERLAAALRRVGCSFIRIASVPLDHDEYMLVTHDRRGARLAAEHLADLGHVRIAFIAGREGFRSAIERQCGFEEGLTARGLALDPRLVAQGDYTFNSGVEATSRLLASDPPPTAVFAANDEMAAGALQALRLAGLRAPDAVSVVGFDDFQIASNVWPRLTSVHSPTRAIGERAASRLLDKGEARAPDDDQHLMPHLVVRESSGPPPA